MEMKLVKINKIHYVIVDGVRFMVDNEYRLWVESLLLKVTIHKSLTSAGFNSNLVALASGDFTVCDEDHSSV